MKEELLNEKKYKKASNGLFFVGVGLIIVGIVIFMIMFIPKIKSNNPTNKEELQQKLNELRPGLEKKYDELKAKGVVESWDYKNKEGYQMNLIDVALDPTYGKCEHSSTYSDNDITREYCTIKAQIYDIDHSMGSVNIISSLVPALMVLMPCLMIGLMLIIYSKQRSILAYQAQSVMPVAQEGTEKFAPTIGKAAGTISKEIAKGIKEGLKDAEDSENIVKDEDKK